MIIKEEELEKRLNNPLNLINRLKGGLSAPKRGAMDLFVGRVIDTVPEEKKIIPVPEFDVGRVEDSEAKIKLAVAHDSALNLLTSSLNALQRKVDTNDIKASSIPSIITSTSRVITDIRKERLERDKAKTDQNIHYHFYCPNQRKIDEYEVIDVSG